MKIGVDFGTTHTSAAVYDGRDLRFIELDGRNTDRTLLRSMLYITREQVQLFGREAVETYLREDTGRIVRYEDKVVGTVENTVAQLARMPMEPDGPITIIYDVVVAEDVSTNGRLIQSIKTALRDASYEGTNIYGRFYPLSELISLLLAHVRLAASEQLNEDVREVVLGRPVRFTPSMADDAVAEAHLRRAAEMAGFERVSFEREPIAAALFYTHKLEREETVFVFDFGGGTLDMTLMRVWPQGEPEILATHGVLVGGDDLDSALMMGRVAQQFGVGAGIDEDGAPFPSQMANLLRRWQTIPQLSRPQHLTMIRRAKRFGRDGAGFGRLETLVTQNYGFQLFEGVERGKRVLSTEAVARIVLDDAPALRLDVGVTRRAFQRAIVAQVAAVQRGLTRVLAEGNVAAEGVDTVVTTGGSSLIPIFQMILRNRFGHGHVVHSNTFGSVTAGLAIRAHQQGG